MDFILRNKILAVVIVVIIAGGAWYFLSGSSSSSDAVLTTQATTVPPDAQQLIDSLNTLHKVKLDGTIFQNPSFQALRDLSQPIQSEPVGRSNPFAPIGVGGSVPTNTTATQ